jgi:hypothetical protein
MTTLKPKGLGNPQFFLHKVIISNILAVIFFYNSEADLQSMSDISALLMAPLEQCQ